MPTPISRIRLPYYLYDSDQSRCTDSAWMFKVEADLENLDFKLNNKNQRWIHIKDIPIDSSLELPMTEHSIDFY